MAKYDKYNLSRDKYIKLECLLREIDMDGSSVVLRKRNISMDNSTGSIEFKHDDNYIVLTKLSGMAYITDGTNIEVFMFGMFTESVELAYANSLLLEVMNNGYIPYIRGTTFVHMKVEMDPETYKASNNSTVMTSVYVKPQSKEADKEVRTDVFRIDCATDNTPLTLSIHGQLTNMIEKWGSIMEPLTEDNSDYIYYLKYGKEPPKENSEDNEEE